MMKTSDVKEFVCGYVYDFLLKGHLLVYTPDEIYAAFLALYYVKAGKKDFVYNQLESNIDYIFKHDKSLFDDLCRVIKSIDRDDYLSVYTSIIDDVIEYLHINYREFNNYVLPDSLTYLFNSLACEYNISSVFNPFAGFGSIPMAMKNVSFYSQEHNAGVYAIGLVLLDAHGYDLTCFSSKSLYKEWNPTKAECVISLPPFAKEIKQIDNKEIPVDTFEEFLVWNFQKSTEKYAFIVVSKSFCYDAYKTALMQRKSIIENNYVDAVVTLPSNFLYGTGISTFLLILNKERRVEAPVAFIDASHMFKNNERKERVIETDAVLDVILHPGKDKSVLVSLDDIRENKYILNPSTYVVREQEKFPVGYQVTVMKDLVEPISPNRNYFEKEGRIVTISQLFTDISMLERTPESFEVSNELKRAYKVKEPAVLLSSIGTLKATYCTASPENPIFVHPHVRAFRLKEKWINPAYLCLQLSKSKGYIVGDFVPHISLSEILRIKVAFPSIGTQQSYDEQGRLYNEAVESATLAKAKELGLQEVINKMKAEYMIEVRNRKHDMKTPMTQLRNTLTLLDAFAKGLPVDQSLKLQGYINRQRVAVDTLSEIVRHLADEESYATPEVFDIDTILRSFEEKNDQYEIIYVADEVALNEIGDGRAIVKMGKSDFLRLVNNIIGNAIQHGFVDNSVHYGLFISLSVADGAFIIRFINNGRQLPDGMDKARFGMKGVKGKDSKGQGTGGSVVKSVTEHYGGDYDIYTKDAGGKLLTVVDIKLPIYQEDGQI